jgi:phosphoglycerate dehydrogenase-like enzyme
MTVTVVAPDELGLAELSKVDGVTPLRHDLDQPLPAGYQEATVLAPGFRTGNRPTELVPRLPKLEYVQLLTAGAESWINRVSPELLLSTCRGAHSVSTAELALGGLITLYRNYSVVSTSWCWWCR